MFNLLVSGRLAKVALIFVSLAHAHARGDINKELRSEPPPSKSLRSLTLSAKAESLASKARLTALPSQGGEICSLLLSLRSLTLSAKAESLANSARFFDERHRPWAVLCKQSV